MINRIAILLLALGLAYQPVSAQAASFQTTDPDATQARDEKTGDEEETNSDYLIPAAGAVVGTGLVAGSFATGMWEGNSPAVTPPLDEGGDDLPVVTVPPVDPVTDGGSTTSHVTVPEPGTLGLLAVGVFGLIGVAVFRRNRSAA